MTEIYGIYAILLLISTIITSYLAFYSWNKRSKPYALYFSLLMLSVSIWSITGALEMATISIAYKVVWSELSYLGIAFIGPLWLLFSLSYTGHVKWLDNKLIAVLMIIPAIILVLVATNGWYGLIWPTITTSSNQPGALLIYGHGTGFFINAAYTYALMLIGILLFIQFLIISPKIYQKQVLLILFAAIVPFIANAIYIGRESPVLGLDITPFAFTITGVLVAWSIFKFKLLDIVPVAYNNLFDRMSSGALIIDSQLRIVDVNPAAINLLKIDAEIIGTSIEDSKDFGEFFKKNKIITELEEEIKIDSPVNKWLDVQITSLDKKKQLLGWLITFTDINARKIAEESLKKSEKQYRNLVDNALIGIYKTDPTGRILFANNAVFEIFGYSSEEDISRLNITSFYRDSEERETILNKLKEYGKLKEYEVELQKKDGTHMNILLSATMDDGTISGMLMDITKTKKAEEEIKRSLHEKDMLVKEIHHRVKNNLTILSSLLNLQSSYIKDETSKNIFKESQNRARSMAIIHELLYKTEDLKRINFGDYIHTLTTELFRAYVADDRIKLNMDVEEVMVDINTAIPLGLIVNELVSNSMKHAFPENRRGTITIAFNLNEGVYSLVVADDGVGFPEDMDIQKTDSLGLRIVNMLTEQIEGDIKVERENGTKITIEFKEESFEE